MANQLPIQQQPSPTHMNATLQQAAAITTPRGQWTNGLFSCFDEPSTCCVSTLCPCIVYAQNRTRFEHLKQNPTPHPAGGDSCNNDCFLHALLTGLGCWGWILETGNRSNIRQQRYGTGGEKPNETQNETQNEEQTAKLSERLTDCCTVYWCKPCALTQESRELHEEEKKRPSA